jgi:hypothetical protein
MYATKPGPSSYTPLETSIDKKEVVKSTWKLGDAAEAADAGHREACWSRPRRKLIRTSHG